jgi:hypothetical protein
MYDLNMYDGNVKIPSLKILDYTSGSLQLKTMFSIKSRISGDKPALLLRMSETKESIKESSGVTSTIPSNLPPEEGFRG